ncbi:MAG: Unknown protein [uncultured Thiotrichaceae bacterium]|uniref:Class I SAM-dependent methyltransferase n=1 Tax=uncultured Thiotrichaceae bacterium TaxID=298394 RepID=A0A6S6U0X7_9GAMM|nr:MAG: Unknown protein [uncultured Thiotrichaceae bacterium]
MYYQYSRSEMKPFFPTLYFNVFEMGCGEGIFSKQLNQDNIQALWGIEPSEEASKVATENGYKVLTGLYDDCVDNLPDQFFDLVICNDVIEHMVDHDDFLEQIKKKITVDGVIVGLVPNVRYYKNLRDLLFKRDWEYQDAGVLDRTHLRFFTERSLKRCFTEHNYEIQKVEGINRARGFKAFIAIMMLLSLFTWGDIKYVQFAFRIRKTEQ